MKHTGCVHLDPATPTAKHAPSGKAIPAVDYHAVIRAIA